MSMLDERGQPSVVERAFVCPPRSKIGPIPPEARQQIIRSSLVFGTYEKAVDRESAYERLQSTHGGAVIPPAAAVEKKTSFFGSLFGALGGGTASPGPRGRAGRQPDSLVETMAKSTVRAVGSSVGREIVRGLLGSIFGGGRKR